MRGFPHIGECLYLTSIDRIASPPKIVPRCSGSWYEVMYNSKWLINNSMLSKCDPVTHIHVIVIIRVEAADLLQSRASCRHVCANEMRKWCASQWKTLISATKYPVELMWKPTGAPHFEYWQWRTTHGAYPFVFIRGNQPLQPIGSGISVVVEKCEHLPTRELGSSIASGAKVTVVFICQNDQWYRPCWALYPEEFFAPPQQLLIMIDAHDDLDRW